MPTIDEVAVYDGGSSGTILVGHFDEPDTYAARRPRGMDDWLITFTLGGIGWYETPQGRFLCHPGDAALLRPGTPHQYGTVKGGTWHFMWAHFSSDIMETSLLPSTPLLIHQVDNETTRKRILRALRRMLSDSRERSSYWYELCQMSLREVLLLLAQRASHRKDARIEEVLHHLSRRMREPVRIDELAAAVGLSASRLSHLFKENTGLSIIDALNQMRIREAALLLQHSSRSASEVALDVGYQSYNHFAVQFRRQYGVSPTEWKKRPLA